LVSVSLDEGLRCCIFSFCMMFSLFSMIQSIWHGLAWEAFGVVFLLFYIRQRILCDTQVMPHFEFQYANIAISSILKPLLSPWLHHHQRRARQEPRHL
jgi:hypothetical protein